MSKPLSGAFTYRALEIIGSKNGRMTSPIPNPIEPYWSTPCGSV